MVVNVSITFLFMYRRANCLTGKIISPLSCGSSFPPSFPVSIYPSDFFILKVLSLLCFFCVIVDLFLSFYFLPPLTSCIYITIVLYVIEDYYIWSSKNGHYIIFEWEISDIFICFGAFVQIYDVYYIKYQEYHKGMYDWDKLCQVSGVKLSINIILVFVQMFVYKRMLLLPEKKNVRIFKIVR